MSAFRHLIFNLIGLPAAAVACIYIDPYSMHRVMDAPYEQFDLTPDENGFVHFASTHTLDFRLPVPQLSPANLRELHQFATAGQNGGVSDVEKVNRIVTLVRSRLNRIDDSLPSGDQLNPEQLYNVGNDYYCLCGEHSRLLNAALQAEGLQSRILWMEGHIVVEYFDASAGKWVFLDPHLNLRANSSRGVPLSISQLTYFVERDIPVVWEQICSGSTEPQETAVFRFDPVWYRNILLNGECYTLSGETLASRGRWDQLVRYGSLPQVLSLRTPFDTSSSPFTSSFRLRAVLLLQAVVAASFYLGRSITTARTSRHKRASVMPLPRSRPGAVVNTALEYRL